MKAQHIVFITLLKVFIHRLAHFPFHYVEELPPLFSDSKFIFARASSVIAFLSGMSIIWIWIVTLCYCLIACIACACFLCVHSIPTHLFLYFVFVSALVCICVCCCLCVYLSQVRDRVTGRERVTQAATFISLCFSPHLFLYICPPIFEHYLKYVYCVLCMQF